MFLSTSKKPLDWSLISVVWSISGHVNSVRVCHFRHGGACQEEPDVAQGVRRLLGVSLYSGSAPPPERPAGAFAALLCLPIILLQLWCLCWLTATSCSGFRATRVCVLCTSSPEEPGSLLPKVDWWLAGRCEFLCWFGFHRTHFYSSEFLQGKISYGR